METVEEARKQIGSQRLHAALETVRRNIAPRRRDRQGIDVREYDTRIREALGGEDAEAAAAATEIEDTRRGFNPRLQAGHEQRADRGAGHNDAFRHTKHLAAVGCLAQQVGQGRPLPDPALRKIPYGGCLLLPQPCVKGRLHVRQAGHAQYQGNGLVPGIVGPVTIAQGRRRKALVQLAQHL